MDVVRERRKLRISQRKSHRKILCESVNLIQDKDERIVHTSQDCLNWVECFRRSRDSVVKEILPNRDDGENIFKWRVTKEICMKEEHL